jgi:hypothetical protein
MRSVKRALDPNGIMNPGKIFALEQPSAPAVPLRRPRAG